MKFIYLACKDFVDFFPYGPENLVELAGVELAFVKLAREFLIKKNKNSPEVWDLCRVSVLSS